MTDARRPPQRIAVVDALRALALFPVVAVNWTGYSALPDIGPLAPPVPAGAWGAELLDWFLHALVAGKGIMLLAFLFGYGQALSHRHRAAAREHRSLRMRRLLLLGVLHGTLLYMGDILTTYALCGLLMLGWMGYRMPGLRRLLWLMVALNLVVIALSLWLYSLATAGQAAVPLATPDTWLGWTLRNAGHYLSGTFAFVLVGLPLPLLAMTAGLMAGRLRLFSHPRWHAALRHWSRRWLLPALLLNIAFATLLWPGLREGDLSASNAFAIWYLYPTLLLLSAAVPALVLKMSQDTRWLNWLAPLGRATLTLYLGSSVLSWALFSGAGLSWQPGTVVVTVLALLYWGGGLCLARVLGPRRLPLEAWLSR